MFTYDGSFAMCVTGAPGTTQTPSATHARTHRQHHVSLCRLVRAVTD